MTKKIYNYAIKNYYKKYYYLSIEIDKIKFILFYLMLYW